METPQIKNALIDEANNVTYVVMAYRKLTREELIGAMRYYKSTHKKKPKRGDTITILTAFR